MCPLVVTVRMIQIWLSEDNLNLPSYPLEWSEVKWPSRVQLCDPMDCILPGSSVHGIFQARVLQWVTIFFSRGSSWSRDWTWVSSHCGQMLYPLHHQGSYPLTHHKVAQWQSSTQGFLLDFFLSLPQLTVKYSCFLCYLQDEYLGKLNWNK